MLCSLLYYTLILTLCRFGGVAQLGERLLCKQEVVGSIPITSTNFHGYGPVAQLVRARA